MNEVKPIEKNAFSEKLMKAQIMLKKTFFSWKRKSFCLHFFCVWETEARLFIQLKNYKKRRHVKIPNGLERALVAQCCNLSHETLWINHRVSAWIAPNHKKVTASRSLYCNSTSQPLYQGTGKPEENEAKKSLSPKGRARSWVQDIAFLSSSELKLIVFHVTILACWIVINFNVADFNWLVTVLVISL